MHTHNIHKDLPHLSQRSQVHGYQKTITALLSRLNTLDASQRAELQAFQYEVHPSKMPFALVVWSMERLCWGPSEITRRR